jgi:hypothetical protein
MTSRLELDAGSHSKKALAQPTTVFLTAVSLTAAFITAVLITPEPFELRPCELIHEFRIQP